MEAIKAAGPDALVSDITPHAHDTRSISTSWALFQGVPIEEIHKAAYWRSPNSFISFILGTSLPRFLLSPGQLSPPRQGQRSATTRASIKPPRLSFSVPV